MTFHILKSQMGWHFPHGTPYCFKCWKFQSIELQIVKVAANLPPPLSPPIHLCSVCSSRASRSVQPRKACSLAPKPSRWITYSWVTHLFLGNCQVPFKVTQQTWAERLLWAGLCARHLPVSGLHWQVPRLSLLPFPLTPLLLSCLFPTAPPAGHNHLAAAVIPNGSPTSGLLRCIPSPLSNGVIFLKWKSYYYTLNPA